MSGGGGGGGSQTSTTVQSIPVELKPLAEAYTQKAIGLGNQPFQAYYGQRYANPTGAENAGLNMITNRAIQGSPLMNQASSQLQDTIQGKFVNANPYLPQSIADAQGDLLRSYNLMQKPAWDKAMQSSGSFGNSGVAEYAQNSQNDLMKNLGRIGTDMRMGAYNTERGYQQAAMSMAPQFANQAYTDANNLLNAGAYARNFDQQNRDFAFQQYQDQQNLPYKQLAAMSGVFGSNLGGTSTTTATGGGGK